MVTLSHHKQLSTRSLFFRVHAIPPVSFCYSICLFIIDLRNLETFVYLTRYSDWLSSMLLNGKQWQYVHTMFHFKRRSEKQFCRMIFLVYSYFAFYAMLYVFVKLKISNELTYGRRVTSVLSGNGNFSTYAFC